MQQCLVEARAADDRIVVEVPWVRIPPPSIYEGMKVIINYEKPDYVAPIADHHISDSVPIGDVACYDNNINVNGIGFDSACGNKDVLPDCDVQGVEDNTCAETIDEALRAGVEDWINHLTKNQHDPI